MGGEFTPARKLVVGYFAQHQQEELDLTHHADRDPVSSLRPKLTLEQVRGQLGGFGFSADKAADQGRASCRAASARG